MTTASQRLSAFHRRVEEIEALHKAGKIGNETRRTWLEDARDASKVSEPVNRIAPPPRAQSGKLVGMSRAEINAAKRAGRHRHDQPSR